MLKKLFDWTPSDIAQWEKIRRKGLQHFILWYGVQLFGGGLFALLGATALLVSISTSPKIHITNSASLGLELLFIAAVCILGGVVNSLLTWSVEEIIYRKIMGRSAGTASDKADLS
jgi:hypothetical protein